MDSANADNWKVTFDELKEDSDEESGLVKRVQNAMIST